LTGVIVSGLTEADTASQIPPGRADDPSRRQTELNVPTIRPIKKILTTLTVIAATALGAQGQTTVYFPNSGTTNFTGLTFNSVLVDLPGTTAFTRARLLIGASGLPVGTTITFSNFTLAGQGIGTTLNFANVLTRTSADNVTDP